MVVFDCMYYQQLFYGGKVFVVYFVGEGYVFWFFFYVIIQYFLFYFVVIFRYVFEFFLELFEVCGENLEVVELVVVYLVEWFFYLDNFVVWGLGEVKFSYDNCVVVWRDQEFLFIWFYVIKGIFNLRLKKLILFN